MPKNNATEQIETLATFAPENVRTMTIDGQIIRLEGDFSFANGLVYEGDADYPTQWTIQDGAVIDLGTGEVIGTATPESFLADNQERMTDGLADWVMSKMLRHQSRHLSAEYAKGDATEAIARIQAEALEALEKTPEMIELRAVQKNAQKVQNEAAKALEFFHARYDRALGDWAAMNLGTSKKRTWTTAFGSVSLKKIPAKLKVADEGTVLAWARIAAPAAVKESFLVSGVPADAKADMIADPAKAAEFGFQVVPESETVTVSTGI